MRFANYRQPLAWDKAGKAGKIDPIATRGNEWMPPGRGFTGEMSEADFKKHVSGMTPGRIIVKDKIVAGWFMAVNLFVVRING